MTKDPFKDLTPTKTQAGLVALGKLMLELAEMHLAEYQTDEVSALMIAVSDKVPDNSIAKAKFLRMEDDGGAMVLMPIGILFSDQYDEIRDHALKAVLKDLDAKAFMILSEAWTLPTGVAKPIDHEISEDDRRISIMNFLGQNTDGDTLHVSYRIIEGKRPRTLADEPEHVILVGPEDAFMFAGRLTGLLPTHN